MDGLMGSYGGGDNNNNNSNILEQFQHEESQNHAHNSSSLNYNSPNRNNNTSGYVMDMNNPNIRGGRLGNTSTSSSVKAKIMSHPHYNRLFAAYISCQKVYAFIFI